MQCPDCNEEIVADSFFCNWCSAFVPAHERGVKANLATRAFAWFLDGGLAVFAYFLAVGLVGAISEDLGVATAILFPLGYMVWFLVLLKDGYTPGKKLLSLQVVKEQTGEVPGWGRMFLRELPGRFLSGLIFGLGYLWALFDDNAQAWHDLLAGTVVLKRT